MTDAKKNSYWLYENNFQSVTMPSFLTAHNNYLLATETRRFVGRASVHRSSSFLKYDEVPMEPLSTVCGLLQKAHYTPLILPDEGLLSVVAFGFGFSTLGLYL